MARTATWLAIAVGSLFGALAALVGPKSKPAREVPGKERLPRAPLAKVPSAAASAAPSLSIPASAHDAALAEVMDAGNPATTADAEAPESASSALPEVTSALELQRAAIQCDAKAAEQCLRAANAYQSGKVVPQNLEHADLFRRRARTHFVSHCDRGDARACLTLVRIYRDGDGVEPNPRLVEVFEKRLRDLCSVRSSDACTENRRTP